MIKALIVGLFLTIGVFGQQVEKTISLVDSSVVSDSLLIPQGYYPVGLRVGDLNKISEFEFDFRFPGSTTWYTLSVPDSNFAVGVSDNVTKVLPKEFFEFLKGRKDNVYLRLDPNDSDTTTRNIIINFSK